MERESRPKVSAIVQVGCKNVQDSSATFRPSRAGAVVVFGVA
jgi:hypothetical protein